jgi:hypothetical protein
MASHIYSELAVIAPEILLPTENISLLNWSVIACDQYTSEPEYWEKVDQQVGNAPSALRMILPEVFLESLTLDEIDEKIRDINLNIPEYLGRNTFRQLPPGFIVLDRSSALHPSRKGLILAIDLEQYDFMPGSRSKVRPTEGTVLSRIPPRVSIRKDAMLEVPHIMVLIDDPEFSVIDPALAAVSKDPANLLYDTDLMMGGGHVTGYQVKADSGEAAAIVSALSRLLSKSEDGFLFAVGDGNHSLATAKTHWENIRGGIPSNQQNTHPARYALVEVVNIHDEGLDFEPIHRVVFGLTESVFREEAAAYYEGCGFSIEKHSGAQVTGNDPSVQTVDIVGGTDMFRMTLTKPVHHLAVGSLQNFLDFLQTKYPELRIDYIHGASSVNMLSGPDALGFLLPPVAKDSFFDAISTSGVFPRKTFSMGEAQEKRYYLEAKMIVSSPSGGDL